MAFLGDLVKIEIKTSGFYQPKKRCMKEAIPVAGRSFGEYILKRLTKDNLGFIPIQNRMEALTAPGQYISSVIPNSVEDLLVYFHELGHNKSKQPRRANRGFFGSFSNCNGTIECEYNAWVWAVKYFRRLGYQMTTPCKELIKTAFKSYIDSAEDEAYARLKANQLSQVVGIDIQVREKSKFGFDSSKSISFSTTVLTKGWEYDRNPNTTIWFDEFSKYPAPKKVEPVQKPKNHKPWHDLKQQQMKRAWKHQK